MRIFLLIFVLMFILALSYLAAVGTCWVFVWLGNVAFNGDVRVNVWALGGLLWLVVFVINLMQS